jgi:sugar lactone lactonase YvrE
MKLPVLFVIIFIWSLKTTAQTIPGNTYHPEPFPANPVADGWTALTKCDDCYEQVQLPFTYTIYGNSYNSVYINTNGILSFTGAIQTWVSTPFPMRPSVGPVFAPFWTDADTRGNIAGNTNSNKVWYKFYPDRLVVIWNRVGYYDSKIDSLSTFEAVLYDNSVPLHRAITDFDVRLTCDTLRWVRGSAANTPYPVAGWDAGNGVDYYNMPGSATANLTGYPGPFSRVFQLDYIRDAQPLQTLPSAPVIRYPDTIYYKAGIPITPVLPVNTGGTVPVNAYGSVSTYAGSSAGYTDSVTPLNARFNRPAGLAVDRLGNVYVGDCGNSRVRKIPVYGNVTTYSAMVYDTAARGLATNVVGSVYRAYGKAGIATGNFNNFMYGNITGYKYNNPTGITVDSTGNVYVADRSAHRIHFSTASGNATTISRGLMNPVYAGTGTAGMTNGAAATASFNQPTGVALDTSGNLYVADLGNNQIRKITKAGIVSLFAGDAAGAAGLANGTGTAARFNKPFALTVDRIGNVYVADSGNHVIRKITSSGIVTTWAGSGVAGLKDTSVASEARFDGLAACSLAMLVITGYGK